MKIKMKDIKLKVQNMSDEELIEDATEQYKLANNDSRFILIGSGLFLTGIVSFITIVAPLILCPIGLLLMIFSPKRNNKIRKIMFKELKKRGYKVIIKGGFGINSSSVTFIKNKY